ncbi:MAG: glycoside hydrolase family 28 protein, partial [Bacteroidota bacterium]
MQNRQVSRRRFVLSGGIAATAAAMIPLQTQAIQGENDLINGKKLTPGQEKPSDGIYNIRDYGAKGDGVSPDTAAINKTIESCSQNGGGKVLIPPGVYLSGTIRLRSNMVFHIEAGATILGSTNLDDYRSVQDENRRSQWLSSLIFGENISNVEICGQGEVNGNNVFNPKGEEEMRGPHAINFRESEDITIRDIFVKDAGNYAHLFQNCTNGSLRGVRVSGGWDGIDLFNCKNFLVTDCQFTTGDDCVAGGGWENIVVSNCTLNSNCNGMRNYRGGLKDVVFSNIVITGPSLFKHRTHDTPSKRQFLLDHNSWHGDYDSLAGFQLAGGGVIENLIISNVVVKGVRCPIWMSARGMYAPESPNAAIRNVHISNLTATGVGKPSVASLIQGSKERPIE